MPPGSGKRALDPDLRLALNVGMLEGAVPYPCGYDIACLMRLVLGTNVAVAGVRSDRGASRRLLVAVLEGRCRLLVSASLLIEYEAVLRREEQRAASGASNDGVGAALDTRARIAEAVGIFFLAITRRPLKRDSFPLDRRSAGRGQALRCRARRRSQALRQDQNAGADFRQTAPPNASVPRQRPLPSLTSDPPCARVLPSFSLYVLTFDRVV